MFHPVCLLLRSICLRGQPPRGLYGKDTTFAGAAQVGNGSGPEQELLRQTGTLFFAIRPFSNKVRRKTAVMQWNNSN